MTDEKPKLHSTDEALISAAKTGEGRSPTSGTSGANDETNSHHVADVGGLGLVQPYGVYQRPEVEISGATDCRSRTRLPTDQEREPAMRRPNKKQQAQAARADQLATAFHIIMAGDAPPIRGAVLLSMTSLFVMSIHKDDRLAALVHLQKRIADMVAEMEEEEKKEVPK